MCRCFVVCEVVASSRDAVRCKCLRNQPYRHHGAVWNYPATTPRLCLCCCFRFCQPCKVGVAGLTSSNSSTSTVHGRGNTVTSPPGIVLLQLAERPLPCRACFLPLYREYTAEIMFETFGVPGLYIAVQAVLALAASWSAKSVSVSCPTGAAYTLHYAAR